MRNFSNHDVIVRQLQAQISEYASALNQEKAKRKKLRECLSTVAEKVCDSEYGNGQLGGKNQMLALGDTELRDFIVQNSFKQKSQYAKSIQDLQALYWQEAQEKEEISRQLVELRQQYNQLAVEHERLKNQQATQPYRAPVQASPTMGTSPRPWTSEDIVEPKEEVIPESNMSQTTSSGEGDDKILYHNGTPFVMKDIRRMVDVYQSKLLKLLGDTGINEQPEIINACVEAKEFGSTTVIRDNLKTMVQNHLLDEESISTPIRKKLTLYSLSEIGVELYRQDNHRAPKKDDKTKIKEMHATLPHGYCIKDTVSILGGLGYTDICMDSSQNSITIADGRRYVPDITAKSGNQTTYWEVELGHHHDADMAEKLEKAAKVAKTVYIVVDKAETKKKLQKQVSFFRKQLITQNVAIDLILYVGTMTELQRKMYFNMAENKIDLRSKK